MDLDGVAGKESRQDKGTDRTHVYSDFQEQVSLQLHRWSNIGGQLMDRLQDVTVALKQQHQQHEHLLQQLAKTAPAAAQETGVDPGMLLPNTAMPKTGIWLSVEKQLEFQRVVAQLVAETKEANLRYEYQRTLVSPFGTWESGGRANEQPAPTKSS